MRLLTVQILLVCALIVALILLGSPIGEERLDIALSDLIGVSGILAGILMAYLSAKVFQTRGERLLREGEVIQLSNKLTAFRKVLYRIVNSDRFWVRYSDITALKHQRRLRALGDLPGDPGNESRTQNDSKKNRDWHSGTISLFLSMETIVEERSSPSAWAFDPSYEPKYSLRQLDRMLEATNQIWYFLDGRYHKHMLDMIDSSGIHQMFVRDVNSLLAQIDPEYEEGDFSRLYLAKLGSVFYSTHIPKLMHMLHLNRSGLPRAVRYLFCGLVVVMVFGVVIPMLLQSASINSLMRYYSFVICVTAAISGVLGLLIVLFGLLKNELDVEL